jgi:hypothetical protein
VSSLPPMSILLTADQTGREFRRGMTWVNEKPESMIRQHSGG